jgi:hypothetical protein
LRIRRLTKTHIKWLFYLTFQGAKLLGNSQINKAVFGFLPYILLKMVCFVGLVQDCNHVERIGRIEIFNKVFEFYYLIIK